MGNSILKRYIHEEGSMVKINKSFKNLNSSLPALFVISFIVHYKFIVFTKYLLIME